VRRDQFGAQVIRSTGRLSYPVFAPDGHLACLVREGKRQFLRDPCARSGGSAVEAYGPAASSAPRGITAPASCAPPAG